MTAAPTTEQRLAGKLFFDWDDAAFIVVSFCMICKYHSFRVVIYIYIFTHLIVCEIDTFALFL